MEGISFCCSALWKVRKSNASESMCIQPDGPARNSPLQEAKHVPFLSSGMTKILGIGRGIRLSNFPPKSRQKEIPSKLWLVFRW